MQDALSFSAMASITLCPIFLLNLGAIVLAFKFWRLSRLSGAVALLNSLPACAVALMLMPLPPWRYWEIPASQVPYAGLIAVFVGLSILGAGPASALVYIYQIRSKWLADHGML